MLQRFSSDRGDGSGGAVSEPLGAETPPRRLHKRAREGAKTVQALPQEKMGVPQWSGFAKERSIEGPPIAIEGELGTAKPPPGSDPGAPQGGHDATQRPQRSPPGPGGLVATDIKSLLHTNQVRGRRRRLPDTWLACLRQALHVIFGTY